MSIDEAIAHAREVAKRNREQWKNCPADRRDIEHQTCEQCAEEHEQLAEWLEELKIYQQHEIICNKGYNAGYNKAIDDLRNELKNHYTEYNIDCVLEDNNFYSYTTACNYLEDYIDEIAEQLKAGGESE